MATINIQLIASCISGGHGTVRLMVNSIERGVFDFWKDDLLVPISMDDVMTFTKLLIRAHAVGKTKSQVETNLAVGLNIVV